MTERLANDALDSVTLHCRGGCLARYRKTEARVILIVHSRQHGKVLIGAAYGVGKDPFVLFSDEQTPMTRETKFAAALGSVTCQDF